MAETITRQYREPFVEAAGLAVTEEGKRLLRQAIPTATYTGSQFVAPQAALEQQARTAASSLGALLPQQPGESAEAFQARQQTYNQAVEAGTAGLIGADAYKQFMSPYQQEVIDTSLAAMEREQAKGIASLRQRAAQAGAFGGGREAAALGEYQATADIARAAQEAQLRQQGFQQAQQQALAQLQAQQGLGTYQSQLGSQQRQVAQAELAADQEAAREAAFADYTRLGLIGPQLSSVIGGFPAATQVQSTPPPSATQQILGLGIGAAGLAGAIRRI